MDVMVTGVLVLLGVAGMFCLACGLFCRLLLPDSPHGTWAVVWGSGAGEELEQRVRGLMWLQSCGLLRCTVVVADGGLDGEGRALAAALAARYPTLVLCTRQELERRVANL